MKVKIIKKSEGKILVPIGFNPYKYIEGYKDRFVNRSNIVRFELHDHVLPVFFVLKPGKEYTCEIYEIESNLNISIYDCTDFIKKEGCIFGGLLGLLLFYDQNISKVQYNSRLYSFENFGHGKYAIPLIEYNAEKETSIYYFDFEIIPTYFISPNSEGNNCNGTVSLLLFKEI